MAAKIPNARTYKQNHRVRRWDLPEATFLPRVDAYSQIWFPDLHTMIESMDSPQQAICYEDLKSFSDTHVVTVQEPGIPLGKGRRDRTKLALILSGNPAAAPTAEADLYRFIDDQLNGDFVLRVNKIVEAGDSTPIQPPLGAFAEIWLPSDAVAESLLKRGLLVHVGDLVTAIAMLVDEVVLVEGPEL